MSTKPIHVTILDDHPNIVDGYRYRLGQMPQVEVVAACSYGEELEPMLAAHPSDVLLLDVNVPTSLENPNPYPILALIPKLLQQYPDLNILVISMHAERGLIRAVMEAGASGYLLKDDPASARDLGNIVALVAAGGVHFSPKAYQLHAKTQGHEGADLLTVRQREALSMCAAYPDDTTADIARKMSISNSTARNLLSGAYVRLNVSSRSAAVAKARQLGILTPDSTSLQV